MRACKRLPPSTYHTFVKLLSCSSQNTCPTLKFSHNSSWFLFIFLHNLSLLQNWSLIYISSFITIRIWWQSKDCCNFNFVTSHVVENSFARVIFLQCLSGHNFWVRFGFLSQFKFGYNTSLVSNKILSCSALCYILNFVTIRSELGHNESFVTFWVVTIWVFF